MDGLWWCSRVDVVNCPGWLGEGAEWTSACSVRPSKVSPNLSIIGSSYMISWSGSLPPAYHLRLKCSEA